jgi:hypothetical protein
MLSTKNLRLRRPSKKLAERYLGPFKIIKVTPNGLACELELPESMKRLPSFFHVSLLEPYHRRSGEEPVNELPPEPIENEPEWEVEAILDDRRVGRGEQFRVRWKDYGPEDDTWEPARNLRNAGEMLQAYKEQRSQRPTGRRSKARRARVGPD